MQLSKIKPAQAGIPGPCRRLICLWLCMRRPLLDLIRNIAGPPLPSSPIKGLCCARWRGVCSSVPAFLSFGVERDLEQKKCSNSCPVFLLCIDDDLTKGVSVARRRGGAVCFRGEGASTGSEEREADAREAVSLSLSHPLLPNRGALFRK